MFSTSIHTNASIFEELHDQWFALLEKSITNYIFQTPEFLSAWWKTLGSGELRIVTIYDGEKLIGIAPFCLKDDELCFVGCVNVSDYLDVIVDREYEKKIYATLENVLRNELTWKKMYLCSLPESSPTRDWLKTKFSQAKETQQDVSPAISLPSSWGAYLASIDRKQRHEIRRKMRRVAETDHVFELVDTAKTAKATILEFIELHKASSAEKRDFWDDAHLAFFTEFVPSAAEAGWLRLYFLQIEGKRTAAMMVFDYNNQYLLYNSGFNPNEFKNLSTGNVLTAYTIQQAIEQKKTVYDFLRGDEEYKFRFGAVAQPVFDISITA